MRSLVLTFFFVLFSAAHALADFSACDAAYHEKDVNQKIDLYTICITKGGLPAGDRSGAYNNRGIAYQSIGKIDEALADFSRAIKLDPTWGMSYLNRAAIYVERRQWQLAEADLTAAVRMRPARVRKDEYEMLLRVHLQLGDYAGMAVDLEKLTRIEPRNVLYQRSRAWLLATCGDAGVRDGENAVKAARKAVAIEDSYENEDVLAVAYAEAGRFDDAVASEMKAIDMAKRAGDRTSIYEARLALFQQRMPYHEPEPPPTTHVGN